MISYFQPVCIGLQETFLLSNISLKLRGYNSVRKDAATGANHSGGVCILTSNLYSSIPLALHTSLQAVAVQVHARNLVTICSVYFPPHDVIGRHDLDYLIEQLPTPFLLLGDFNGHCALWGSDVTNSRGRQIEQFPRAKALARRIRRRNQRESWINLISSKQLWEKVHAANGIYREFSFPVLNTGNVIHSAPLDIANTLGHAFTPVSANDSYSSDFRTFKNRAERTPLCFTARNTLPYNTEFRMFQFKRALSLAHETSPGPDGITYNTLRHLNTTSLSNLLFLFNRIWTEQKYPSQWHEAIVIPILKPGKNSSNPLNYRPIALTSCLFRTLERMVNVRLIFELEKQGCNSLAELFS
ncbi:hypothetical protein AVEN_239142-1 [Araneus ventricosus]|uniref:Endonuclease/exonuclease/phosphatase domain-containing protein n=1 Tax=Araneus ventricosus TaxID=182803 RepID=A0A4Y2H9D4_ARAVE|nr:hypothetical protein AVEN_239142-1 [Araneus ventricosus]